MSGIAGGAATEVRPLPAHARAASSAPARRAKRIERSGRSGRLARRPDVAVETPLAVRLLLPDHDILPEVGHLAASREAIAANLSCRGRARRMIDLDRLQGRAR